MDIDFLASIQRRTIQSIPGIRTLLYEDIKRNRIAFSRGGVRGDVMEIFKWKMEKIEKGDMNKVLEITVQGRTRSNGFTKENFRFSNETGEH